MAQAAKKGRTARSPAKAAKGTNRTTNRRTKPRPKATASRAKASPAKKTNKWSAEVTRHSDALDLEPSVFKGQPGEIARSLKRSAERSKRRKSTPYRSAMSMLTFYINRAGKNLPAARLRVLERAKDELRHLFKRG